jgi:outer membrane lipoprotein-sorting protein
MFSRAVRLSACGLLAAATLGSCSAARADAISAGCEPATNGIAGMSAAQAIKTVTANIPKACGFTISGVFEGAAFGDGWQLTATSTYGTSGAVHLVYVDQGTYIDFRTVGGVDYVRLSGGTVVNNDGFWPSFGIKSSAVMKAAGTTKWVRLRTPAKTAQVGEPLTAAAFAAEVAQGPWTIDGTATVHGVRCTVLESKPQPGVVGSTTQWLYVNTATGLPVQIGYYYQTDHKQNVTSFFGSWGHAAAVTPPPVSEVVAG